MVKSPVVSMSEMTSGLAPTLVIVTFIVPLVVLTPCLPKAREADENEAAGVVTPLPVKLTITGLEGSSELIISVPVLVPAAVGVNVTFIVQPTPVDMGSAVQVLEGMLKSPVVSMSERLSGFTPTLVRFTLRGTLVVLKPWFPKATEVGETEATEDTTPVPVSETIKGLFGSLEAMTSVPVSAPDTVGV